MKVGSEDMTRQEMWWSQMRRSMPGAGYEEGVTISQEMGSDRQGAWTPRSCGVMGAFDGHRSHD